MNAPTPLVAIPRITTARLVLRQFRMTDFEAFAASLADRATTTFMGGPSDRRAAWRTFAAQTGSWLLNGGGWWAVEQRESGAVVGTVGAFFRENAETLVELGWSLYPTHWGHGFATEAAAAALQYAIDTHDARRAVAHIAAANLASIGVSKRLGMSYEADVDFYGEPIGRYAFTRGLVTALFLGCHDGPKPGRTSAFERGFLTGRPSLRGGLGTSDPATRAPPRTSRPTRWIRRSSSSASSCSASESDLPTKVRWPRATQIWHPCSCDQPSRSSSPDATSRSIARVRFETCDTPSYDMPTSEAGELASSVRTPFRARAGWKTVSRMAQSAMMTAVLATAGGCTEAPSRPAEVPAPSIDAPSGPRPLRTADPGPQETVVPSSPSTPPSATPDSDRDGIIDALDACPSEPGMEHSNPAKNGCPYIGPYRPTEIRILTTIPFSNGDAGIANENNVLLAEVAKALLEHPEFTRVRMTGHAARGEKNAILLSEMRAKAVLKVLTTAGVDAMRLIAVGTGDTQPIDSNDTTEGRAKNRRVEFQILER